MTSTTGLIFYPTEYNLDPSTGQYSYDRATTDNGLTFNIQQDDFQILNANTQGSGSGITGFMFAPTYTGNCSSLNSNKTVTTTLNSVPVGGQFGLVLFTIWTTPECVMQALQIGNNQSVKAMLTYLPQNAGGSNFSAGAAPPATDPVWSLQDNNAWKGNFGFPVYALNSNDAGFLNKTLQDYSGNISSVPDGALLASRYTQPGATVRAFVQGQTYPFTQLPSLWVFLLIVVAILVGILLVASVVMRFVQRRRRRELHRMILSGEVNIESLGIGRVKVTPEVLRTMPLYIYVNHGEQPGAPHAPPPEDVNSGTTEVAASAPAPVSVSKPSRRQQLMQSLPFAKTKKPVATETSTTSILPAIMEEKSVSFPQDTCAICLDDFENHVTPVRWLPCGHAFHHACIDPLLCEYSSLCPICKQSVLPKDYVPEITNVMVRRERLMRRIRDLEARDRALANHPQNARGLGRFAQRNPAAQGQGQGQGQGGTRPTGSTANAPAVEMQTMGASTSQPASGPTLGVPATERTPSLAPTTDDTGARRPENVSREEWARQRAGALVGTSETVEEAEQREERRLPMWRRVLGPVFPTLRS